jgi:hypothetical protein
MRVIKLSGDTLDEIMKQAAEHYRILQQQESECDERAKEQHEELENQKHIQACSRDMSKVFWITKTEEGDSVTTIFNVVAPFAIESSIKASLKKIDNGDTILRLRYENNFSEIECSNVVHRNFDLKRDAIEYSYNFRNYKVDKKKMKLYYKNGIISLHTSSTQVSKDDDFTIGL